MLETLQNKVEHIASAARINAVYLMYQEGTRMVYIGSSGMPGLRTSRHMTLLKGNRHDNPVFQALYNENPNFYCVYYTVGSREEAYTLEQALVDYYHPTGKLINIGLDVKAPNRGRIASAETREKQRLAKLGVARSDDAKRRVSEGMIGRVQSDETRKLLSIAKKGKPQPEHIAEMCRERNRLRSKPVSINGVEYPSIREASRELGVSRDIVKTRIRTSNPKWVDWFFV